MGKKTQGIGSIIRVHTVSREIEGKLSGVSTGFITVQVDDTTDLHVVFNTVISFSFHYLHFSLAKSAYGVLCDRCAIHDTFLTVLCIFCLIMVSDASPKMI